MTFARILLGATMMLAVACVPQTVSDDDDDGGCQADVDCKGDRLCVDGACVDSGETVCDAPGETCDAESCCGDALCASYSGDSGSFTACESLCTLDADCATGCCLPLGDSGSNTCAPADYCIGGVGGSTPEPGGGGSGGGGSTPGPGMGGDGGSSEPGMSGTGGSPAPGN